MNIAELSIRNKTVTLVITFLFVAGGIVAYANLPRLEDPEFTIKEALIITPYPGASSMEVEEEVSEVIEKAAQQLGQLERVESKSERGLSTVTAVIKDKYDKATLPQVWDELRRKVSDAQSQLPPRAGPSIVRDDYGDVFGVFFAVTGKGYSNEEIRRFVDTLKRELLLVRDVAKIEPFGVQDEVVYVRMASQKMAQLGISQQAIYSALAKKNLEADAGRVKVASEYITIDPTGAFASVEEMGNLLISGSSERLVYLKDVATIERGYVDPPKSMLRFDGQPALGLAISTVSGGNVVKMGKAIEKRLSELQSIMPIGMEIGVIALQSEAVSKAVKSFVSNLLQAVAIVIVVLLIFMGLRSGLIIGAVLFLTISGTLLVMNFYKITLERISLGALVIALGMLVDNAIVITEGILVKVQQGVDRVRAAIDTVKKNMLPLLGATAVAVVAFGAIGLSKDSTGEYCRSLFQVILISLGLSWLTAVTVTPLFCTMFLKAKPAKAGQAAYQGSIFRGYRKFLHTCLRFRLLTCGVLAGLLVSAIYGFGWTESSFFPNSTRPQFMVDYWLPRGTHISETKQDVKEIERYIMGLDGVEHVSSFVGQGAARFLLVYAPEKPDSSYAQFLVSVDDHGKIEGLAHQIQQRLDETYEDEDAITIVKKFKLGPGAGGNIQVRFSGPSPGVLRGLAGQAEKILEEDGGAKGIRNDWRQRVKLYRPRLSEAQARRTGITRADLARALEQASSGTTAGIYREGDRLLPIVSMPPEAQRAGVDSLKDQQIWSPAAAKMIPLRQVVAGFDTVHEDPIIMRRNRKRTITVHCDQKAGNASTVLSRVKDIIEAIRLDPGYEMAWGGEHEDSSDAQAALAKSLPFFLVIMVLTVIALFNSLRQPLIIWMTVPLAIIGVTAGLLTTGQPFGFMALLGLLSLSGMLIKNSIVLIDEIDLQIKEGTERFKAVMDSSVSRMRPVLMAAVTTVLGMIPLLRDAFFVSMAVTIMAGLTFATVLTLIVVPALYSIFFGISEVSA
ncbi:MAG: efflux RND transporter permease subunit [Planctomycetota bacterium]|jgi:multidrug efflux pump subunit AcrB